MRHRLSLLILTLIVLVVPIAASAQFPGRRGRFVASVDGLTTFAKGGGILDSCPIGADLIAEGTEYPSWTPNGDAIVFDSDGDGDYDIYRFKLGRAGATNLTDNDTLDWGAHQGPNRIVFVCERPTSEEICSMNLDGGGLRRLTNNDDQDWNPKWSPEGSRIVFSSDRRGDHDIFTMNADGTHVRRLTDETGNEHEPDFSPNGMRIVFWSDVTARGRLFVMSRDGSHRDPIPWGSGESPVSQVRLPTWSPNGARIAFGTGDQIWIISIAGGDAIPIVQSGADDNIGWQPRA